MYVEPFIYLLTEVCPEIITTVCMSIPNTNGTFISQHSRPTYHSVPKCKYSLYINIVYKRYPYFETGVGLTYYVD